MLKWLLKRGRESYSYESLIYRVVVTYFSALKGINSNGRKVFALQTLNRLPPKYLGEPVDYDKGLLLFMQFRRKILFQCLNI